MATSKINWIVILQGWAILWVVIGHAPLLPVGDANPLYVNILYKIAYSFHMPLFVFVSGYLFHLTRMERPMPYARMLADKLARLGIPFIAFTLVAMVFKSLFSADMARPATISVREFANAILFPGDGPLSELWFVATLMWYFALRPLWQWTSNYPIVSACVLAALFCMPELPAGNLLCYQNALHYALFFYLGIMAHKERGFDSASVRNTLAIVAVIIGGLIIGFAFTRSFALALPLCGIACSILIARFADRYLPRIFFSFRDCSYQIYLMGIFAQIAVKMLYKHGIITSYPLGFVLCILCGIYLPVAATMIVRRIGIKYLKLCIGLK